MAYNEDPYGRKTMTKTPVMDLRSGDKLSLDSGNYIVTIEHIALVRGLEVEIVYRYQRTPQTKTLTLPMYATLDRIED